MNNIQSDNLTRELAQGNTAEQLNEVGVKSLLAMVSSRLNNYYQMVHKHDIVNLMVGNEAIPEFSITDFQKLEDAIWKVLKYTIPEEAAHYAECGNPDEHIYNDLMTIKAFLYPHKSLEDE